MAERTLDGARTDGAPAKVVVSWSSGKDAALTLHRLRHDPSVEVVGLLTTITREYARVSMHGVREELLEQQAAAAGLPLEKVEIPAPCPNEVYDRLMAGAVRRLADRGVTHLAFGDLFLEDIRAYRESRLAATGLRPLFPLWGIPTRTLAEHMLMIGIEAWVVCLDPRKLSPSFAGRRFDAGFLADLPAEVDPCGENGEFHTFVSGGPMFRTPIRVHRGEVVERDGFLFADLVPAEEAGSPSSLDRWTGRRGPTR